MSMARGKRLEVIKREFGASMYYLEATCSLSCADLEFCNLVFNTQGVAEYLLSVTEHSLGLWKRREKSEVKAGVSLGGREYMFSFGRRAGEELMTLFLDCRYGQVRICGAPEVVSAFVKLCNGEIKAVNILSVASGGAILR